MGDRVYLQITFPNEAEANKAQQLAERHELEDDGLDLRSDAGGWNGPLDWSDDQANYAGQNTQNALQAAGISFRAEWSHGGEFDGGLAYSVRVGEKLHYGELPCGMDGSVSVPVSFSEESKNRYPMIRQDLLRDFHAAKRAFEQIANAGGAAGGAGQA